MINFDLSNEFIGAAMRLVSLAGARLRRAAAEEAEKREPAAPPSHHSNKQFSSMKSKFFNELTHLPMPMWAIGAIVVVVLALIVCMGFCIYKKCISKGKKPKKVRERKGGRGRRKKDKDGEDGGDKKRGCVRGGVYEEAPTGGVLEEGSMRKLLQGVLEEGSMRKLLQGVLEEGSMRKLLPPQTDRWSHFLMKCLPHCLQLFGFGPGETSNELTD
ncbi:hypothetical protein NQZ68_025478 [Dissostichus eleginoides]|nr:hypothetical protein NQZ68_025478 [Dissostichus eleginoides]